VDFTDYYEILGVEPTATQEEIKRAFKKLARKYHPDVSNEADAQAQFQAVSEAYEMLKDETKRAEYDELRAYVRSQGQRGANQGFRFDSRDFSGDTRFEDILGSIFGRQGFDRGGFSGTQGFRQPGRDLHYKLQISLEEAHKGGDRQLRLQTRQGEKTISVKIPAGISSGKELRLRGQGEAGMGSAEAGDLYLQIEFLPHAQFEVDGNDIILVLPVSPWEAALGSSIEVPTLTNRVKLRIPSNSQNGTRLRLKGKGLAGAGDQFVVLKLINPKLSTDAERAAFEALAARFSRFNPRLRAQE